MSRSDWIQIGILITYTLTLLGGGLVALLKFSHVIVDIEERQKRIDIAADQSIRFANDIEKKLLDIDWRNKFFLTGLILVLTSCMFLLRIDTKKDDAKGA